MKSRYTQTVSSAKKYSNILIKVIKCYICTIVTNSKKSPQWCMHARVHAHTRARTPTPTRARTHTPTCARTHTTHTYIHTYIHTHTHTHPHTPHTHHTHHTHTTHTHTHKVPVILARLQWNLNFLDRL
jgi:hypothetical protein